MSLKNSMLALGMSAVGLFWVTLSRVEAQDAPPTVSPIPNATTAPTEPKAFAVLLLTNGRLLKGTIIEEGDQYVLTQAGGSIPIPKRQAEKAFHSMEELYQYKKLRVPEGDADEQYKLAKWCLEQGLDVHARENLQGVLAVSPKFTPAQRMIANIDANATVRRKDGPLTDDAIARAGAEMPAPGSNASTSPTHDPRVARARREMMKTGGVPVIFDLPTPIAVKRATEFSRNIHGILQQHCASCHNEKYDGDFQLIQVKIRRDLTPEVLRANLDATLPLINRETPDRSEVLAATLLPHGPARKQILRGPRDPAYLALAAWVNSLRSTAASGDAAVATAGGSASAAGEEAGFGRDRVGGSPGAPVAPVGKIPALSPVPDAAALYGGSGMLTPDQITRMGSTPGAKVQSSSFSSVEVAPGVPQNVQFPTPGAPLPKLPVPAPAQPTKPVPSQPSAAPIPADGEPKAAAAPVAKKKKGIDPALLERVLKARQAGAPQP